jgi:hypothetical protein
MTLFIERRPADPGRIHARIIATNPDRSAPGRDCCPQSTSIRKQSRPTNSRWPTSIKSANQDLAFIRGRTARDPRDQHPKALFPQSRICMNVASSGPARRIAATFHAQVESK